MLVNGWTLMGQKRSSYEYTMGFDVSAQVDNRDSNKLSTRDRLSSLLSSNKFSLSVRRSLALYDFYRHFTMSQKSDKATRIAVKTTGARLFLSSTPPHLCNKIKYLTDIIFSFTLATFVCTKAAKKKSLKLREEVGYD